MSKTLKQVLKSYREDKRFNVREIDRKDEKGIAITWTDTDTALWNGNIKEIKKAGKFESYHFGITEDNQAEVRFYE